MLSCDAEIAAFGLFAPNTKLVVTTTGADVMLVSTTSSAAGNRMMSTIRKAAELKESISPANVKSTVTVVRYMEPGRAGGGEGEHPRRLRDERARGVDGFGNERVQAAGRG